MPVFTTETLIMALINLANETEHYFSVSVSKHVYVVWFGPNHVRVADLEQGLAKAYRYLTGVAKEQGLTIVEDEEII